MSAILPPPELVLRYMPIYQDCYWRFAQLHQSAPCRLTSLYRDKDTNFQVGGHPRSLHLLGLAADWVVAPEYKASFIATATWLDLIPVDEATHVHVQRYIAGALPAYLFPTE